MAKTPKPAQPESYELTVSRADKVLNIAFVPGRKYTVKPHVYQALKDKDMVQDVVAK